MTRVSTMSSYNAGLSDLMRAQARHFEMQRQVSTEKKASDLKGFGRDAETLTAVRTVAARVNGFIDAGKALGNKLETQNAALGRVAELADDAKSILTTALANGRGDALMVELQSRYQAVAEALNTKHQGRYIFAGALVTERPVVADTLADLAAAPVLDDVFKNDDRKATHRLDETTTVQTGFLADEIGRDLLASFRRIQEFATGPGAPMDGQLTDAQKTFIQSEMAALDAVHNGLLEQEARNGGLQTLVDETVKSQQGQAADLEVLIGEKTGVDMAEAVTRLQQAELAVQASAQVLAALRGSSLLDLLR